MHSQMQKKSYELSATTHSHAETHCCRVVGEFDAVIDNQFELQSETFS